MGARIRPCTTLPSRTIDLRLEIDDDDEIAELERALLKAKATELGEARRRNVRLSAGYGDTTTREVLDDEVVGPSSDTTPYRSSSRRCARPAVGDR